MSLKLEQARQVAESLQNGRIQNLFAQSQARHVLYEVNESQDNFPDFDPQLSDKIDFSAYSLLAASCSLLEWESDIEEATTMLESAATLLLNVHGPFVGESSESNYQALVASMALYAAGQYSRAFVSIRKVESYTDAAKVIAPFIRKDTNNLLRQLNIILLRNKPEFLSQVELDDWAIANAITHSLASVLEYVISGNIALIETALSTLRDAMQIAISGKSPSQWWIVRLLILMLRRLGAASLWNVLPPFFYPERDNLLDRYIRLLAFKKTPVIELWASQRAALSLALNSTNRGGVVNLKTGAGKTRVAELAILQTLSNDPTSRILYLAPFRSLAIEVEKTLSESFSWLGFPVSHLYGGSRVSSVDTELVSESSIIIATPEKTRALNRVAPELFRNIKLIIIDEGHLIGPDERLVKNELFIDHLRSLARTTGARMLLLSAVLPNTQELAEWVTGDPAAVAASYWKPSNQRCGLLRWNGERVQIDWLGDVDAFNPYFVVPRPLGFGTRRNLFPHDKNEAIAATAIRLSSIGSVMIFTARASSVETLARAVLLALGEKPVLHPWPEREWAVFKAVCSEELEPESIVERAARVGIICHSNRLTSQVRMAVENLMRSAIPKVIIATTTLGQGVNIGISSVIVANPHIDQYSKISKRDFWNICGRAGRAFVDGEGKILYAIDETNESWKVSKDIKLANEYFDTSSLDRVESGLLYVINILHRFSKEADVSFDVLLELLANNDFTSFGKREMAFEWILDLLDDELLALHEDISTNNDGDDSIEWVEAVFRESLAVIQMRSGVNEISAEDVISFLKARTTSILTRVPEKATRMAIVASSLSLSVAILVLRDIDFFKVLTDDYLQSDMSLVSLAEIVRNIEIWARENASSIVQGMPDQADLDNIRLKWLGGVALRNLIGEVPEASRISKDFYGYQLPWIIHAISQKLDKSAEEERANALSSIALLVEIGVPSEMAARIFLAGIRSRVASTELAGLDIQFGKSVITIRNNLRYSDFVRGILPQVTPSTREWLNLLLSDETHQMNIMPMFASFTLENSEGLDTLYARIFEDDTYLTTIDGRGKFLVTSTTQLPFRSVADDPKFVFKKTEGIWSLVVRDPRYEYN